MSYLVDTNVIAEIVRRRPDAEVASWFRVVPDTALHLSVLSLGELRKGVERRPAGVRRERLRVWLEQELPAWFEDRLLPVSKEVADRWGRLAAEVGRSLPAIDGLLAATALHHGLRLVTRNVRDFRLPGLEIVNPWR
ncbi:MAG: type II toxin-antitoxin system VapC family toxin [Deltaproteobacteria bacterium]|nr:type II toxin-antitoxin system VapC family toxin [Deltaproteobacteria bacterium]